LTEMQVLVVERQAKSVEHDAGNEGQKSVAVDSEVEKSTSAAEHLPADETEFSDDSARDETKADAVAVDKQVKHVML